MKKILILGLALCMGVSLSSCEDDHDVRPMSLTPTGTITDIPDESEDTGIPDEDIDDESENFIDEVDASFDE